MSEHRHSAEPSRHVWLSGPGTAQRAAAVESLPLARAWLPRISAHRALGGPYTAAGELLRRFVPEALRLNPDLVRTHEVEVLSVAPELQDVLASTSETLTSLAVPNERTRYYSTLRTLRIAHGLVELIRDHLREAGLGPRSLFIDDLHQADFTDREFVAVLLRRVEPELLTVVVGSTEPLRAEQPTSMTIGYRRADGDLPVAAYAHCRAAEAPAIEQTDSERLEPMAAGRRWVESDGTDEACLAGYQALPDSDRQRLHDERAAALVAGGQHFHRLAAIPFHLARGGDRYGAGVEAMLYTMNYCMRMGFYDVAADWSRQGIEFCKPGEQFELWWRFAGKRPMILSAMGFGDEAVDMCEDILAATDDLTAHSQIAYSIAMLYTRHLAPTQQDNRRALGWINTAIALSSALTDPKERAFHTVFNWNGKALVEVHRRRLPAALELVTAGIQRLDAELEPHEHRLHRSVLRYNRGQVYAGLGRIEEALVEYRAVIAEDPNYPEYHFDVANLLHKLGRDDEALAAYDEAIRLSPPFPELHYNRADVLVGLGRYDEAIDGFGYVLELEPDYLDAYINRAGMLADLGESERAAEDVRRGLELAPANAHLLALRGRLELEAERPDSAREALDAAIEADPELAGAWALRGALNFGIGALAEALADLDRAAELDPDPTVLFNRASAARALGRWADAERGFSAVLEQDPAESDGWLCRAECRRELGNLAGARADAEAFQRLAPERAAEVAALLADANLVGADG